MLVDFYCTYIFKKPKKLHCELIYLTIHYCNINLLFLITTFQSLWLEDGVNYDAMMMARYSICSTQGLQSAPHAQALPRGPSYSHVMSLFSICNPIIFFHFYFDRLFLGRFAFCHCFHFFIIQC